MEVTTGQLNGRAPISHALCMSLAQLTLFSCSHAFDFIYFEQRTSRAFQQKKVCLCNYSGCWDKLSMHNIKHAAAIRNWSRITARNRFWQHGINKMGNVEGVFLEKIDFLEFDFNKNKLFLFKLNVLQLNKI